MVSIEGMSDCHGTKFIELPFSYWSHHNLFTNSYIGLIVPSFLAYQRVAYQRVAYRRVAYRRVTTVFSTVGKVQWNSLAIEILLHQTFRQLTAAFVSGMTTRSVCAVKYKCVTVRDE